MVALIGASGADSSSRLRPSSAGPLPHLAERSVVPVWYEPPRPEVAGGVPWGVAFPAPRLFAPPAAPPPGPFCDDRRCDRSRSLRIPAPTPATASNEMAINARRLGDLVTRRALSTSPLAVVNVRDAPWPLAEPLGNFVCTGGPTPAPWTVSYRFSSL